MGRAKKCADRIRAEIDITKVLSDFGYEVREDGGDREQQFCCDLHGDGRDNKPSARAYPSSNSWYCFACGRTRDAIQTTREKEGVDFWTAIKTLETRYHLSPLPWDDDDVAAASAPRPKGLVEQVRDSLTSEKSFEEERIRVERLLQLTTNEREMPLTLLLGFWEAFDRVTHGVTNEGWSEMKGKQAALAIRTKILECGKST